MQIKKVLSDWANKWFFVKEKTPRVIIGLGSAAIGIAVYIFADIYYGKMADDFFIRFAFKIIGFVAAITITFILCLSICGIYNFCKFLIEKRSSKTDNT